LTYISLSVGDPQEILDQQLRPHQIHLLNIIIILISYNNIHHKTVKLKKLTREDLVVVGRVFLFKFGNFSAMNEVHGHGQTLANRTNPGLSFQL
jgi:hypothetical protein